MARRKALLIGNELFNESEVFPPLRTPKNDATEFASILKNYGEFEITNLLIDQGALSIKTAIEDFYNETEKGDLTVLYYSGHGHVDRHGNFYLVGADTSENRLLSTGISEEFVRKAMRLSKSVHRALILDCCFSGAITKQQKAGSKSVLLSKLQGEAIAILTSSASTQESYEEQGDYSLFTKHLIGGIISGQADGDNDGYIDIEELFQFVDKKVRETRPEQTPMIWLQARESRLIMAVNPKTPVRKRLDERKSSDLPLIGVVAGDQRLTLLELCTVLFDRLVAFGDSLETTLDDKNSAIADTNEELNKRLMQDKYYGMKSLRSESLSSSYRERFLKNYPGKNYPPPSDSSLGPVLALIAHKLETRSISQEFLQMTKEETQQIVPLFEPIIHMAIQSGLDKSDLWPPVENSINSLRSAISDFNQQEEKIIKPDIEIKKIIREISTAGANLSRLIGGLDGWKLFDPEERSENWFRRKIGHSLEINRFRQRVQEHIGFLTDSYSSFMIDALLPRAIQPSLYSWRKGEIPTLHETAVTIKRLSKEWQSSNEGREVLSSHVASWYEILEAAINELIEPVYHEFNIPANILNSGSEFAGDESIRHLSTLNFNINLNIKEIEDIIRTVLKALVPLLLLISFFSMFTGMGFLFLGLLLLTVWFGYEMGINSSNQASKWARRKLMETNFPKVLRKLVHDKKMEEMLKKNRFQIKASISTALRSTINENDIILALQKGIDRKINIAIKYFEDSSLSIIQSDEL